MLDFQPGLKAPHRYLHHSEIGQLAVVMDKSRLWIVRHNGVRISKVDHRKVDQARAEAEAFYVAKCGAAKIIPQP